MEDFQKKQKRLKALGVWGEYYGKIWWKFSVQPFLLLSVVSGIGLAGRLFGWVDVSVLRLFIPFFLGVVVLAVGYLLFYRALDKRREELGLTEEGELT